MTSVIGKVLVSGTALTSFSYSYTDALGSDTDLRQSVTDNVSGVTTSYGYDVLNRLISAQGGGQNYAYAYDGNGNRTSQTINGVPTTYSYNAANQLTQAGDTTYSYDGNGSLTGSSAGLALTYNAREQTTSSTPPGAPAVSFTYAGPTQIERLSADGRSFGNSLLGLTREDNTSYVRDDDGNLVVERIPGQGSFYYLFDGLGSVVGVTDSTGALVATYTYDPYGKPLSDT